MSRPVGKTRLFCVEVEPAEMLAPKGQATAIRLSLPRPEVRVNVEEFAPKRSQAFDRMRLSPVKWWFPSPPEHLSYRQR